MDGEPGLPTAEALALCGLSRSDWSNLLHRDLYAAAPASRGQGRERLFTVTDTIALFIVGHFMSAGLGPAWAGRIASAVREELAKPGGDQVATLWVVCTADDRPHRITRTEPPDDVIRYEFPVAAIRQQIEGYVARRGGGGTA